MFVSKRLFEARMDYMEREYNMLNEKYWRLANAHSRLLEHLGLVEIETPKRVRLVSKGGPEPSET